MVTYGCDFLGEETTNAVATNSDDDDDDDEVERTDKREEKESDQDNIAAKGSKALSMRMSIFISMRAPKMTLFCVACLSMHGSCLMILPFSNKKGD